MMVRKRASVHPKTVTKVSKGHHTKAKPKRKPARKHPKLEVHIKVDPRVWEKALELCEGEPSRIEVISSEEVIVHNSGWRK
jgi:hypothetical protein